jgi:hypothetical protein
VSREGGDASGGVVDKSAKHAGVQAWPHETPAATTNA